MINEKKVKGALKDLRAHVSQIEAIAKKLYYDEGVHDKRVHQIISVLSVAAKNIKHLESQFNARKT